MPEPTYYFKIKVLNLVSWERSQTEGSGWRRQHSTVSPGVHGPESYLLWISQVLNGVLSSDKMFYRQAEHCEQQVKAVLGAESEAGGSLILPNTLLSPHVLYLQGLGKSALQFLMLLMNLSRWLSAVIVTQAF